MSRNGTRPLRLPHVRLRSLFASPSCSRANPCPKDAGQLSGDDREALEELLRQVVGIAATRLEADFGKLELTFVGPSTAAQDGEHFPFSAVRGKRDAFDSRSVSARICGSHWRPPQAQSKDAEVKASDRRCRLSAPTGALTQAAIREGNLELLWDVALSLTLRFGQRELLLKEILELSPGAVTRT